MFRNKMYRLVIVSIVTWICIGFMASIAEAASCKVLIVMSYEEDNPWCVEIKEGIDSVLASTCEVKYFYMDTKKDLKGGPQKAEEAYALYQEFQPDGVIAADDNAQSMFVVPFLKDKVKIPVMFSAVNAEPGEYGYPAETISGILERTHIRESIAFAKQLVPSISTVGFLARNSASGQAIERQVRSESEVYLAKFVDFKLAKTIKEALATVEVFKEQCDLLFVGATNGILDDDGKPLDNKQVTQIVAKAFGKPMIGSNSFHVEFGVLCAVVKSGQEQGRTAAEMLLKAMQGAPISDLPITENQHGKRMINVTVMKSLGIKPTRRALIWAELVTTVE